MTTINPIVQIRYILNSHKCPALGSKEMFSTRERGREEAPDTMYHNIETIVI